MHPCLDIYAFADCNYMCLTLFCATVLQLKIDANNSGFVECPSSVEFCCNGACVNGYQLCVLVTLLVLCLLFFYVLRSLID